MRHALLILFLLLMLPRMSGAQSLSQSDRHDRLTTAPPASEDSEPRRRRVNWLKPAAPKLFKGEKKGEGPSFSSDSRDSPQKTAGAVEPAAQGQAVEAESGESLAKKLANPVASLISVPMQNNFECGRGPEGACGNTLNIQPVIPLSLNESTNLIIRTILPVVGQGELFAGTGNEFGLGDTVQSFFLSPKKPVGGLILGYGPVALYPTATSRQLGLNKWGAGPTALVLKQSGPWTVGVLANHLWSFAGPKSRGDVNATFLQPFVNHTWKNAWSLAANTESTYDWERDQWTVPLNLTASKVTKLGGQLVSIGAGPKVYVARPGTAPKWGFRFVFTLLYPKRPKK